MIVHGNTLLYFRAIISSLYIHTFLPLQIKTIQKSMPNLRRSKEAMAARSRPDGRCKKHPKHEQSPGVCSICLREKLSQLSTSSNLSARRNRTSTAMDDDYSSSSSLSSYYSSSSESSYSSPIHVGGKGSLAMLLNGKNMLTKSRSLAFVPRMRGKKDSVGGGGGGDDKSKKGGFWSKLLHPRSVKRREGGNLMHSRTMRGVIVTG